MSCGCSDGGNSEYNNYCNADTPYPQVSNESVPSLINNLTLALYGSYTKSVDQATGRVVWDVPCTPQTSPIGGLEPLEGEGMLCYVSRALNTLFPTAEPFVTLDGVQTLYNKTLFNPVIDGTINVETVNAIYNNGNRVTVSESIVLNDRYAGGPGAVLDYGNNAFKVVNSNGGGTCLIANTAGDIGLGGGSTNLGANAVKSRLHVVNSTIIGGVPLTSGSAYDPNCIMRLQPGTTALDVGIKADKAMWVQPRLTTNYATNYGISLCPNGGDITLAAGGGAVSITPTGSGSVSIAAGSGSVSIAAGSGSVSIASGGGAVSIAAGGGLATIAPAGNVTLCSSSGFVGIGKSPDASFKVDVNGGMRLSGELSCNSIAATSIACATITGAPTLAKAWASYSFGALGTVTLIALNNLSITKETAAGTYTVTITTPLSSANYAVIVNIGSTTANVIGWVVSSKTNTGFTLTTYSIGVAANLIAGQISIVVYSN
jgi:hypothetical protein